MRNFLTITLLFLALAPLGAAKRRDPLSAAEIDQLRETTQEPAKRIKLFIGFAGARLLAIEQLRADPKLAKDRGLQVHNLLEDYVSIADSLDDNLDMYDRQRADLRKPLKEVVEAFTNWQLKLRSLKETTKNDPKAAEESKDYEFVMDTAIETVNAGLDSARDMLQSQNKSAEELKKKK